MSEPLSRHPLYVQVADAIAEQIAQGTWKPGANMPNEVELARQMGVSAGTMRKALDRLEANHLIVRRQGRGTFIEDHTKGAWAQRYELLRDASGAPLEIDGEVIAQQTGAANELERTKLNLSASDRVLRTTRIRRHGGRPYMYETAVVAISRLPRFREGETGNYLIAALAQKHGVMLGQAIEDLTLCQASKSVAAALKLTTDEVLVQLDRIVNSLAGDPIEWRTAYCSLRNDQYCVVIE